MTMINFIPGGMAADHRGSIRFVNDFDMSLVKRFYIIKNADLSTVRGWRAHRIEQRWFYVLEGAFYLDLVKIQDWENVSETLPVERLIIRAEDKQVVHIPAGYGTAFQAMEVGSELLVFADYGIDNAALDDYTWPAAYFTERQGSDIE